MEASFVVTILPPLMQERLLILLFNASSLYWAETSIVCVFSPEGSCYTAGGILTVQNILDTAGTVTW